MQELMAKTLSELKALCREYSCFKGHSYYTKKTDLIDFMSNRIATLAEVTGVAVPIPVPASEVTVSGFVAEPTPTPTPFEEPEPEEQPDEWVDPDDQLLLTAANCPHCNGNEIAIVGESQEVWRCNQCNAVGWLPDLADENGHCCPDPGNSKEYENKLRWWRKRARYALEQAALAALKMVRPACICKSFEDLISGKLHRELLKADLNFSYDFHQALHKQIKAVYPFSLRPTPLLIIWNEEGRKLVQELGNCIHTPLTRPNLWLPRASKIKVLCSEGEGDQHPGGGNRRGDEEMPDPANYQTFPVFKQDWEAWAATQEDEAEEEVSHLTALEIWWETYPDEAMPGYQAQ